MKHRIPNSRCTACGVLLSREYPYSLCPKHWQEKYHAPPGKNYFPQDKAATKRTILRLPSENTTTIIPCARASSPVLVDQE